MDGGEGRWKGGCEVGRERECEGGKERGRERGGRDGGKE